PVTPAPTISTSTASKELVVGGGGASVSQNGVSTRPMLVRSRASGRKRCGPFTRQDLLVEDAVFREVEDHVRAPNLERRIPRRITDLRRARHGDVRHGRQRRARG